MSSGFNVSVVVSCLKSFMSHPIKMLSTSIEQNGTQHRIFDSGPAVSGSCWDGLLFHIFLHDLSHYCCHGGLFFGDETSCSTMGDLRWSQMSDGLR